MLMLSFGHNYDIVSLMIMAIEPVWGVNSWIISKILVNIAFYNRFSLGIKDISSLFFCRISPCTSVIS